MDLVLKLLDAWNARDLDTFVSFLTDDVEWYDPAMADPPARGRGAVRAFAEAVLAAFPDFKYEIQEPICTAINGSRCAILWKIQASHTAPLAPLGYVPTGRRMVIEGLDLLDIRDGKISRILTAFDPLPAAEQLLGMQLRPRPGTWRARIALTVQRFFAYLARKRS
jgi:steroid delta-isomerase-like uncharacterized protein